METTLLGEHGPPFRGYAIHLHDHLRECTSPAIIITVENGPLDDHMECIPSVDSGAFGPSHRKKSMLHKAIQ